VDVPLHFHLYGQGCRIVSAPELKPCPFCGGEAEWNTGQKGDGSPWRYLACEDCEAMGPHVAEWELSKVADDNDEVLIAAWNRRAALRPAEPVAVKALEWKLVKGYVGLAHKAESLVGPYLAQKHGAYFDNELIATNNTLSEAKAAAQADYETRIRSALVAHPGETAEPVAVERIEMVDYSTGFQQPSEPMWRVEIDGYCADFETETAAQNYAGAINRRIRRRLTKEGGE
jgi:Lar family restriction alleviation protein